MRYLNSTEDQVSVELSTSRAASIISYLAVNAVSWFAPLHPTTPTHPQVSRYLDLTEDQCRVEISTSEAACFGVYPNTIAVTCIAPLPAYPSPTHRWRATSI